MINILLLKEYFIDHTQKFTEEDLYFLDYPKERAKDIAAREGLLFRDGDDKLASGRRLMIHRDWELLHHTATATPNNLSEERSVQEAKDCILRLIEAGFSCRGVDMNYVMVNRALTEGYLRAHLDAYQRYQNARAQIGIENACREDRYYPEAGEGLLLQGYRDQQ